MIRRGFWLAVGAAGGIIGYRRIAPLTRRRWVRETSRFTRDVREGMELYMARHPRQVGPTLGADDRDDVKDDR